MNDDSKIEGRLFGEQMPPEEKDSLIMRFVYSVLIMIMLGAVQTILSVIVIVQLVIMAVNKGAANTNLSAFGTDLGVWVAKAVRYLAADSDVKPWPWTEID